VTARATSRDDKRSVQAIEIQHRLANLEWESNDGASAEGSEVQASTQEALVAKQALGAGVEHAGQAAGEGGSADVGRVTVGRVALPESARSNGDADAP